MNLKSEPANENETLNTTAIHDQLTGYQFHYDVLNRLRTADFTYWTTGSSPGWTSSGNGDYHMSLGYDPNGNIDSMRRNGYTKTGGGGVSMDRLTYTYPTTPGSQSNRLQIVDDNVTNTALYGNDIEDQPGVGGVNYLYDGSGNLIRDYQDGTQIRWNGQGKITQVRKVTTTVKMDLIYIYDAGGQRVIKMEIDYLAPDDSSWVTYFVRDVNETVIAVPLDVMSLMLFIPEGDGCAHNHMNFGHFLWGGVQYGLFAQNRYF